MRNLRFISIGLFVITALGAACSQAQVPADWTRENAAAAKGKVAEFTIDDSQYKSKRKIWVYTPAGYDAKSTSENNLIVSFDGEDYIKDIPSPVILDNLIAAKKIGPTVQVFVDNSADRLGDLANHQKFADFVAGDLMPWVRKNYNVTRDPGRTVTLGYSASGLGAAYMAFKHPEMFGAVLSQSGAFWRGNEGASSPTEWLTEQFEKAPKQKIRFYIVVGRAETMKNASGKSMLETSQHLRDVLKAKGNDVAFLAAPNGVHAPESWRTQVADGLIFLLGTK